MTKFYLHDAATNVAGILPNLNTMSPNISVVASGCSVNRSMDTTPGSSQVSVSVNTEATTATRYTAWRRWLSAPLAAGSGGFSCTLSIAASESNGASNMDLYYWMGLWRPSTGQIVLQTASPPADAGAAEPGGGQTVLTGTFLAPAGSWNNGDVLIFELCSRNDQSMSTSYVNTIYYDGTTEGSSSSIAAYLDTAVELPPATTSPPVRQRPMKALLVR